MEIPGYELLEVIGEGTSGCVYKARQAALQRLVALKVLKVDDEDDRLRFLREAKAAAKLRHRNLVTLIDIGRGPGGEDYIALEYVEGLSLETVLERVGRLPEPVALSVIHGVARALAHVDAHGFVHRDVKPANILIGWDGVAKLVDLGLVKAVRGELASKTSTGQILGTPLYIAPEQIDSSVIDIRADLYALGITLFQCVTGEAPFKGKGIWSILTQHRTGGVPDPRKTNPDVSRGMARLVAGLTAMEAPDRYPSADAACIDLQRVLGGGPPYGPEGAERRRVKVRLDDQDADPVRQFLSPLASEDQEVPPAKVPAEPPPAETSSGRVFRLIVTKDGAPFCEQTFDQAEVMIGRTLHCDLMIEDPRVSRRHACIVREGERFSLIAFPTPNGTRVGQEPIEGRVALDSGERILIAEKYEVSFSTPRDLRDLKDTGEFRLFNPYGREGEPPETDPLAVPRTAPNALRPPSSDRVRPPSDRVRPPSSDRVRPPSSDRVRPPSSDRVRPPPKKSPGARDPARSGTRLVISLEGASLSDYRVQWITVRGLRLDADADLPPGQRLRVRVEHPILEKPLTLTAVVTKGDYAGRRYELEMEFEQTTVQERIFIRRVQASENSMRVILDERVVGFCTQKGETWAVYDHTTAKVAVLQKETGRVRVCFLGARPQDSIHFSEAEDLESGIELALDLASAPELVAPDGGRWRGVRQSRIAKPDDTGTPALRFHKVIASGAVVGYLTVTSLEDAWTVHDPGWKEVAVLHPQQDGSCKVRPLGMGDFVQFLMCPSLQAGIGFALRLQDLPFLDPPLQSWAQ